jgi:hypothetical protein
MGKTSVKFLLAYAAVGLVIPCLPAFVQPTIQVSAPLSQLEKGVLHADSLRLAAVAARDVGALERMLARDWFLISGVSGLVTRDAYLTGLRSGTRTYQTTQHDSVRVRVYGGTAVVTGRSIGAIDSSGTRLHTNVWFTHVYVRDRGRWLMVAMHTSQIRSVANGTKP